MAVGGATRRISAASARAHTRHHNNNLSASSGMLKKILVVLLAAAVAWGYQAFRPPPAKICGSSDAPPVTAPRIKLKDGRHLAYKEHGIPREKAKYRIVFIHGFDCCRHSVIPVSMELMKKLDVYLVSFDRSGYGESDPNPRRSEKSIALDVEELADQLELGSKFYVIGYSMGGQAAWGCLKYIPHRLAGAALLTPVVNYWWPGFPANLSNQAYNEQLVQDQWTLRVAHYLPWLTYWWNTQKWFPSSSVAAAHPKLFCPADLAMLPKFLERKLYEAQIRQQGEYESIHRDVMIGFGSWEFDPLDLSNPFPNNEGSVHLWQGDEDRLVPVLLQRYIAKKLSWIKYHELAGKGHLFPLEVEVADSIVKALLFKEE